MKNRKRMGDRTEPCATPLLIGLEEEQWLSTTAAIEVRKEIREEEAERRIATVRRKFINQSFVPYSIKRF